MKTGCVWAALALGSLVPGQARAYVLARTSFFRVADVSDTVRALRSSFTGTTNTAPEADTVGFVVPGANAGDFGFGFCLDHLSIFTGSSRFTVVTPNAIILFQAMQDVDLSIMTGLALGYDNAGQLVGQAFSAELSGAVGVPSIPGLQAVVGMRILQSSLFSTTIMPTVGLEISGRSSGRSAGQPSAQSANR